MHDLTIGDIMTHLLPAGTRPGAAKPGTAAPDWRLCPTWPPDVFAVAATLADRSGCYAEPGLVLSRNDAERTRKRTRARQAAETGKAWADLSRRDIPKAIETLWKRLHTAWNEPIGAGVGYGETWKRAALQLIAAADEACRSAGFLLHAENSGYEASTDIARVVASELVHSVRGHSSLFLPASLCALVSPDTACVLPKSLTPEVGCTLRSLTNHIALLPGRGTVHATWYLSTSRLDASEAAAGHALTLLLIPFPYVVHGTDFAVARPPEDSVDGYFRLNMGWLTSDGKKPLTRRQLADFVASLIESAQADSGPVHGLVFPETALTPAYASNLAEDLAKRCPDLRLIVCGTLDAPDTASQGALAQARNEAVVIRLENGKIAGVLAQSKHHRWRLDGAQITRYQLGQVLDPRHGWWEDIDVSARAIHFGVNAQESVIAALVCEDLARFDPVMPVLMSVGPNLVFTLLMDGPQFEGRWSGRYATALAEDPGASVLTFTCAGMVRRWGAPGAEPPCNVGLWKSRGDKATALTLPAGAHALAMALTVHDSSQRSLDLRHDGGVAIEYRLGGVRSVKLSNPPAWLERSVRRA
jgi:hypothetical protein